MTIEIDDVQTMGVHEVVEALQNSGDLVLADGEAIGDVRLECGHDLEVDIEREDPRDERASHYDRTHTFYEDDLRECFGAADYCIWAKSNGKDFLLCFGC